MAVAVLSIANADLPSETRLALIHLVVGAWRYLAVNNSSKKCNAQAAAGRGATPPGGLQSQAGAAIQMPGCRQPGTPGLDSGGKRLAPHDGGARARGRTRGRTWDAPRVWIPRTPCERA